jgi:hypothetical protein
VNDVGRNEARAVRPLWPSDEDLITRTYNEEGGDGKNGEPRRGVAPSKERRDELVSDLHYGDNKGSERRKLRAASSDPHSA